MILTPRCTTRVVSSSVDGFRLPSSKLHVIGQGIDTDLFTIQTKLQDASDVIYIGRISRRKRIDLLVEMMASLRTIAPSESIRLKIVGPLLTADDRAYHASLRTRIVELGLQDVVELTGFVPYKQTPALYRTAFVHLNVSQTGSMDKTVLEALACGCPVLTSNPAFKQRLSDYHAFYLDDDSPREIASRVLEIYRQRTRYDAHQLRSLILGRHDVASYTQKIMDQLRAIT